jgi:hypothetical protein
MVRMMLKSVYIVKTQNSTFMRMLLKYQNSSLSICFNVYFYDFATTYFEIAGAERLTIWNFALPVRF